MSYTETNISPTDELYRNLYFTYWWVIQELLFHLLMSYTETDISPTDELLMSS